MPRLPAAGDDDEPIGFVAALFDFSFDHFVTEKLVRLLYVLGIVVGFVVMLFVVLSGLGVSTAVREARGVGLVIVVLTPLLFLVYIIGLRLWFELTIVIFRIAAYAREIARQGRG